VCVCVRARAEVPNGVPNDPRYLQSSVNHHEVINSSGRCSASCHRWNPHGIPYHIVRQGSKWQLRVTESYADPGESAINTFPTEILLPTGRHDIQIPAWCQEYFNYSTPWLRSHPALKIPSTYHFLLNWMSCYITMTLRI
jgi:hypothetical protein